MSKQNNNSLKAMLKDFYNRENFSVAVMVWVWAIILVAIAVWSAYKFSNASEVKDLIMFAMIFICSFVFIAVVKIFSWQIIHRNYLKRRIDMLEENLRGS